MDINLENVIIAYKFKLDTLFLAYKWANLLKGSKINSEEKAFWFTKESIIIL